MLYQNYFSQLKRAIPLLMKEHNIPGFSISMCDKEKIIFSDTYGFTDLSENIAVTATTRFSLQSISKTYTAFGFMLAVQDGKISLDDPIKKYIPDFTIRHKDGEDYSPLITFRQCLTHRAGFRREAPIGSNFVYRGTFDEHIKSINGTFLRFKPNEQYCYSNLGIDLAAYALEKIYDMPFEEYMLKKVFIPLEMYNSTYSQNDFLMSIDSAVGHSRGSLVKYPIMMIGAGGMYSCPDDMTHFIRCLLNQGIYNGNRIMNQEILEQMYNEYPPSEEWLYNFGLVAGIRENRIILNHGGSGFGFRASQDIFLDSGFGAAAMTNSTDTSNIQFTIMRWLVFDDLFSLQDEKKEDYEPIPESYESMIGLYEVKKYSGGSWKLAVVPRKGKLFCNYEILEHHSGNTFFNKNNDCIEFVSNGIIYDNVLLDKCTD
jgi:CubicO group peptidase (beta-lactamase class C family)